VPLQQAGAMDKALHAYERSATAQEKQGSQWHAAKHMEICGEICKNLQRWEDVANFYQRAAQLYQDAGRASTGANASAAVPAGGTCAGASSVTECTVCTPQARYVLPCD
jgi:hypothetical protein